MKSIYKIFLSSAIACCSLSVLAQGPVIQTTSGNITDVDGITISGVSMHHIYDRMEIGMNIDMARLKMNGDRVITYVPILTNGTDSLMLDPIGIYSHNRWIQYRRTGEKPIYEGVDEMAYKYSKRPKTMDYEVTVPYADWMNGAQLEISRKDYGCCRSLIASEGPFDVGQWKEIAFMPALKYVTPVAGGPKERSLEGSAFVDFPVDQTIIYPDYRRNAIELDSIMRTIDVVRNDPDATIKTVWLKGFASPESPYSHNTDLAKGRTQALKNYITKLYDFSGVDILTDYEPEDWEGLRKAVEKSNLEHRTEILNLIDTKMDPDAKEAKIKSLYPGEYRFMLQNFYPPLRHTNYRVNYIVKSYTDPKEILEIMRTRPKNLDLNEYYIAASVLEPGSYDYNDVFETAVRMYPEDPMANLNAANAAIQRNDLYSAERYLTKAGNSADAIYARSILATLQGKYAEAAKYLSQAKAAGVEVDSADLANLQEYIDYASKYQK